MVESISCSNTSLLFWQLDYLFFFVCLFHATLWLELLMSSRILFHFTWIWSICPNNVHKSSNKTKQIYYFLFYFSCSKCERRRVSSATLVEKMLNTWKVQEMLTRTVTLKTILNIQRLELNITQNTASSGLQVSSSWTWHSRCMNCNSHELFMNWWYEMSWFMIIV